MEPLHLMLVEDDTFLLDDLFTILDWTEEGYQVIRAINGTQGLHNFEQFHPMIILTDVRMPFLDGLEMMAEIKRRNPYVQFLVLSAYDDFSSAQEALRQGAKDYLLKQDVSADTLREKTAALRRALEEQTAFALNTAKNRLYELFYDAEHTSADLQERLGGILRLGGYFPDSELLSPVRQFVLELIQKNGDRLPEPEPGLTGWEGFFAALRAYLLSGSRTPPCSPRSGAYDSEPALVAKAKECIKVRYSDPNLSAQEIAHAVSMSYSRLSVLFKEKTGSTLNDYLTDVRLQAAKRLLCSGDYKIYEVAEQVGYRSSQYFSYAFRARIGQSPNRYRKGE